MRTTQDLPAARSGHQLMTEKFRNEGEPSTMNPSGIKPSTVLPKSQRQLPADAGLQAAAPKDYQPMQPAQRQGKLPPEVFVTAPSSNTEPDLMAGAHPAGSSRLDAARVERLAALDFLAGEVSHELAHTLTFLRCLTDGAEPPSLSSGDMALALKQVERLQRMLRHLRKLTLPPPGREPVRVLDSLQSAAAEVAEVLSRKALALTWAVPEQLTVRTEAPLFHILARDLLIAAVSAADPESSVGVHASPPVDHKPGALDLWRRSRGADRAAAPETPDPWAAICPQLGLAVCHRIARTLGWELLTIDEADRQGFRLHIPAASFCVESER